MLISYNLNWIISSRIIGNTTVRSCVVLLFLNFTGLNLCYIDFNTSVTPPGISFTMEI